MRTVSVVIPALNEADGLPALLDALAAQTTPPLEVIVADAGSTDGTPDVVRAHGGIVVAGGMPAAGRNAGAAIATGDILFFLDADVDFGARFLADCLSEFSERRLTVATAHIEPIEREVDNLFACEVANLYLDLMQYAVPHAPGFCILVTRETHETLGGFDTSLALAEDHDYVQRAAELGKFRVLRCHPVRTSMRRIEKEGLVRLAFKYLYAEVFVVAGLPIHETPFEYEFAAFGGEKPGGERALRALRDSMREAAGKVRTVSADTLDALVAAGDTDVFDATRAAIRAGRLTREDLDALRHYVRVRRRLVGMRSSAVLARVRRAGDRVWSELTGV